MFQLIVSGAHGKQANAPKHVARQHEQIRGKKLLQKNLVEFALDLHT